jgi:hypothetical protein
MTPRKIVALGAGAAGAVTVVLGALHFGLDGLAGVLVPLQPALAARTGTATERDC